MYLSSFLGCLEVLLTFVLLVVLQVRAVCILLLRGCGLKINLIVSGRDLGVTHVFTKILLVRRGHL